jgi:hypothetical protein
MTVKILKEKEVIKEEIEIQLGIYYFNDGDVMSKIELSDDVDNFVNHKLTRVEDFSDIYGIRIFEDSSFEGEDIPYSFKQFILNGRRNEITEEEFEQTKQEVLKRIL